VHIVGLVNRRDGEREARWRRRTAGVVRVAASGVWVRIRVTKGLGLKG
jgi:hypothetical protein